MQQCDICNVKQVESKYIFLCCLLMYGDGKHKHNVGSYNDDDLRKIWFQALFTKKRTHFVETTRVRPAVRLWPDISD